MSPEQAALEKVRKLIKRDKGLELALRVAWNAITDQIGEHAITHKYKSFEFRHMSEKARGAFMCSIAAGDSIETATAVALTNVGLPRAA